MYLCRYIYIYIHTHTYTHIYIYVSFQRGPGRVNSEDANASGVGTISLESLDPEAWLCRGDRIQTFPWGSITISIYIYAYIHAYACMYIYIYTYMYISICIVIYTSTYLL